MNATLADITCDSDGKIDKFINPEGGEPAPVLRLHPLKDKQPYYLAMFLTGVYQEVLGSMHNLLGSTNCVVVRSGTRPAASAGECLSDAAKASSICLAGTLVVVQILW